VAEWLFWVFHAAKARLWDSSGLSSGRLGATSGPPAGRVFRLLFSTFQQGGLAAVGLRYGCPGVQFFGLG
jgi:hypothetical protein